MRPSNSFFRQANN